MYNHSSSKCNSRSWLHVGIRHYIIHSPPFELVSNEVEKPTGWGEGECRGKGKRKFSTSRPIILMVVARKGRKLGVLGAQSRQSWRRFWAHPVESGNWNIKNFHEQKGANAFHFTPGFSRGKLFRSKVYEVVTFHFIFAVGSFRFAVWTPSTTCHVL